MNILTLQSQVVFGHVGNSAAVFALQRVGCETWAAPTVLLSNHPGYGQAKGAPVEASTISALVEGLDAVGALAQCDGVLTGYLHSAQAGEATLGAALRAKAAGALWLCDPVFGDDGRIYAQANVVALLRERAAPQADILTPNLFELETLTDVGVSDLASARAAMRALRGPARRVVVCTSFDRQTPLDALDALALDSEGFWRVRTRRLDRRFEGAGDLFSALFLAAFLERRAAPDALARAAAGAAAVLAATSALGRRELALIEAQDAMAAAFAAEASAERVGDP